MIFPCSLSTPLVMDEFGWSETETVSRLGIIMSVGGVLMLAIYLVIPIIAKRC